MCPKEQPFSEKIQSNNHGPLYRKKINENLNLFITRKFDLTPVEAIEFYRGSGGIHSVEIESKELNLPRLGRMEQEPPNEVPLLMTSNLFPGDKALSNILPKRPVALRVSSLLDVDGTVLDSIGDRNIGKVTAAIREILFIDLIKYQEYIGSFLLSMPNPYLRKHSVRLNQEQTAVIMELFLRKGMDLNGGEIELIDERRSGQGFVKKVPIQQQTTLVMPIPYSPEKLKIRIFSPTGNLISEKSSHFMKNVHFNMQTVGPTRQIKIKKEDGSIDEEFEVQTYSSEDRTITQNREKSIHQKLSEAEEYRLLDQLEKDRKFIYFPGNSEGSKQKATEIIRGLVANTRERCIICDPYLSGKDVVRFATHVRSRQASIQLIGSAKHLIGKDDNGRVYGDLLQSAIIQLNQQDPALQMACWVLKGRKKSPLHDRFLIIDDHVYILGSSLNEYGSRATTLFKVPDPRPIERQVESWLEESPSLEDWLKQREEEGNQGE